MHYHSQSRYTRHFLTFFSLLSTLLLLLSACSSHATSSTANTKTMILPNVGTNDIGTLDPAAGPDANSALAINMVYSGLVRTDQNLQVIPDQATWQISNNNTVYTFQINPAVTFSDGTPVTAQSYIYTWTRALLPAVASPNAASLEAPIAGASVVSNGKATSITGLKALDTHTLQVTLTQPAPYFLATLTNSLFFPLNQKVIKQYGQNNWTTTTAGVGTGPFKIKTWEQDVQIVFVPNPYYYGKKTSMAEVDMVFVNDPTTAYQFYRAGRFTLMWNIAQADLLAAQGSSGFEQAPLFQTDTLFFDTTQPPFNNATIRQAFAYATDKVTLATSTFQNAVVPAPTLLPPGMPGYQTNYAGIQFDRVKAKTLFQSVYPPLPSKQPAITFSYPSSLVSGDEAQALLQMWQNALQISIALNPLEPNAYFTEAQNHQIQFGFTQWSATFPDPYALLATNALSTASQNDGQWNNATFDQLLQQADQTTDTARLTLYNQAEQLAINDAAWLPLDHPQLSAIIPPNVHGVTLNGNGLYFGDWSDVYLS